MDVSIVIVTCDRWNILEKNLNFLKQQKQFYDELVLIDNGSKKEPPQNLRINEYGKYIKLPRNMGVSEGRNIGATNTTGDLIYFIDDDGYLDLSNTKLFKQKFKENNIGVISFDIEETNKLPAPTNIQFSYHSSKISFIPDATFQGGACLVDKKAFFEVGMYPADYFYGTEERDLSIRLIGSGYSILSTNSSKLLHYNPSKRDGINEPYQYYRNRCRLYWRNYPFEYAVFETFLQILSAVIRGLTSEQPFKYFRGLIAGLLTIVPTIIFDRKPVNRSTFRQHIKPYQEPIPTRIKSFIFKGLRKLDV